MYGVYGSELMYKAFGLVTVHHSVRFKTFKQVLWKSPVVYRDKSMNRQDFEIF